MPYCNEKRIIFLHIPKTGGTIIKNLFGIYQLDDPGPTNIPSPQPLTCVQLREHLGSEKYDSYYKFPFVRNPWSRVLSHYNWRQNLADNWSAPPFVEFVKHVQEVVQEKKYYEYTYGDHFIPQSQYTSDVNNIFKFEDFEKGVYILSKRLNMDSIDYQPREKKTHDEYWEYYDEKSRRIIAQLYREEIEQFGYEYGISSTSRIITTHLTYDEPEKLKPKFSVIIPSYNLGGTLRKTVDSVLAQSLSGIELIIVDDASTDKNTINFLKVLDGTSIKVIFLKHNTGVAHARNTGIKMATAPYILCLDSDDYIDPDYLQKTKEIFDDRNEIGIVSPWLKFFGDYESVWECQANFSTQELLEGNRLPSGSCVRKIVYEELNYYNENIDLSGLDDWDLWIRVFTQTNWKQQVIAEPLFFYRIRNDSQESTMTVEKLESALRVIFNNNFKYIYNHSEDVFVNRHIKAIRSRIQQRGITHRE